MYMVRFGLNRTRCTRGTVIFDHNLSLSLAYQLTMADRGGCRQKRARWEAKPGGAPRKGLEGVEAGRPGGSHVGRVEGGVKDT